MTDIDAARLEGLQLAVQLHAGVSRFDPFDSQPAPQRVIDTAGQFSGWLLARPHSITVADPVISAQGNPALRHPATRSGANMAVTIKDSDVATYPAPEALDSKGFEVADANAITASEDSGGTVVAMTANADGSTAFAGVAPGAAQVSWTDGTLSFSDTINVTAGDAASLVVGAPVITPQA